MYIYVLKKDQNGLIFFDFIKNCPEYSEILRSVRYNPDNDYIQVYANGVWNNVVLAKLKFNGIFFANGAYNVPYLMGFDYAGIYYQNPDCASMSMGIGFSGDGKIQITHTVHNKTSGTPSQSSGGKYISKNKVNLKGYTNLQVIGYCTAQETGIQNGFYFNIYDQDTNTLLIETLMPTGSNGTVNINIAGIQREVYFGGVIWKYCWGVGASAQNIGYIQSIIAS